MKSRDPFSAYRQSTEYYSAKTGKDGRCGGLFFEGDARQGKDSAAAIALKQNYARTVAR